jgi:hypothetical protein
MKWRQLFCCHNWVEYGRSDYMSLFAVWGHDDGSRLRRISYECTKCKRIKQVERFICAR